MINELTNEKIALFETCKNFNELNQYFEESELGFLASQLQKFTVRPPDGQHLQNNHIAALGWLFYTVANPSDDDAIYYPSRRLQYDKYDCFSILGGYEITPETPKPKYHNLWRYQ